MRDPIVAEIKRALSQATPGDWHATPYSPQGECPIIANTPSGGTITIAQARTPQDAHFMAHSKWYIRHLLHLLGEE